MSPSGTTNTVVTRANGLPVTWNGGDANGYVQILIESATDLTITQGASAQCNVASSAGSFTIPSWVTLALPSGPGLFEFASSASGVPFTANGLNAGALFTYNTIASFNGFPVN